MYMYYTVKSLLTSIYRSSAKCRYNERLPEVVNSVIFTPNVVMFAGQCHLLKLV